MRLRMIQCFVCVFANVFRHKTSSVWPDISTSASRAVTSLFISHMQVSDDKLPLCAA